MAYKHSRLATWQARLYEAQALQATKHREWKESFSLFDGSWFKQFQWSIDPDATAVNYATAYVKTMVDTIYARNHRFPVIWALISRKLIYLNFE